MPAHRAGGDGPRSLPPGETDEQLADCSLVPEQLTEAPAAGPAPSARERSAEAIGETCGEAATVEM